MSEVEELARLIRENGELRDQLGKCKLIADTALGYQDGKKYDHPSNYEPAEAVKLLAEKAERLLEMANNAIACSARSLNLADEIRSTQQSNEPMVAAEDSPKIQGGDGM